MFWQKIYWGSDFCPKQEMSVVAFKTDARQRCRLPILENSPFMLMIHSRFCCFQLHKNHFFKVFVSYFLPDYQYLPWKSIFEHRNKFQTYITGADKHWRFWIIFPKRAKNNDFSEHNACPFWGGRAFSSCNWERLTTKRKQSYRDFEKER